MVPQFHSGDLILINRLSLLFREAKKGEIIAFKHPVSRKTLVKRIEKIKDGEYFVLGTNNKASTDSRHFGWIKKKDVVGSVICRL